MSQENCLKVLKEDEWLPTGNIASKLKQSIGLTNNNLNRLYKFGEIDRKEGSIKGHYTYLWRKKKE